LARCLSPSVQAPINIAEIKIQANPAIRKN